MKPTALIHIIVLSYGWRRWLIAFAAGAFSAAAMAPLNFWPILFVTFPVLVWLIDGAGAGHWRGITGAAATGWWFGFGYFLAGLYWIGFAFLVDAPTFGWLLPIAVGGLPAGLAIFTAFGVALARLLWTRGPLRILALAIALTASEWLRGHVLTGFPWNAFGYALTSPLVLAQSAALIGIWGLTFIAVAIFASPATLFDDRSESRWPRLPLMLAVAVLVGLGAFGTVRLARTPTRLVDGVHLRIMQPNLQQDVRFNYSAKQQVMDRYIALSGRAAAQSSGTSGVTHLIWPELAFPFFLAREPEALAQIAGLLHGSHGADHRRGKTGRTGHAAGYRASTIRSMSSITTARSLRPTTRSTLCRLANTCRSNTFWKASGCSSSPNSAAVFSPATAAD